MTGLTRYRADIDGLRAVAVIPVVLFHAGLPFFSGGYVGVDVFFVISGYLITGLLYQDAAAGRLSVVRFYERRIRRIFPALFTVLTVTLLVGMVVLLPDELSSLGRQTLATSLFWSNLLFWHTTSYFDNDALSLPLLHTWSLAVEEQFYIFFPLALWLVVRYKPRWLVGSIAVALILSLAASQWLVHHDDAATFYLLPTRAWELLVGSLLALVPAYRGIAAPLLSAAGLAAIATSVVLYREGITFPGVTAMLPVFGAAAVICANESYVSKVLSSAPMRSIGLISYSLYLWHWPILVFAWIMYGQPLDARTATACVALSVLLAFLSWRFIERPLRVTTDKQLVWRVGGSCIGLAMLASGAVIASKGLPQRFSTEANMVMASSLAGREALRDAYKCPRTLLENVQRFGPCPIGASGPPALIVVADSHGMAIKDAVSEVMQKLHVSGELLSVAGCPPVLGLGRAGFPCEQREQAAMQYIESVKPKAVLLVAAWRGALYTKNTTFRGVTSSDDDSRLENVRQALADTVARYKKAGTRVGILLPVSGAKVDVPRALARGMKDSIAWSETEHRAAFAGLRQAVNAAAPDVVEDLSEPLCKLGTCVVASRAPLYSDASHLNSTGGEFVRPVIERAIRRLMIETIQTER